LPQQLFKPSRNWFQRILGIRGTLRSPEVGGDENPRSSLDKVLNGLKRSTNPAVITNYAIVQWDIKVAPEKHALGAEVTSVCESSNH
jgi:hypothetical protein